MDRRMNKGMDRGMDGCSNVWRNAIKDEWMGE